MLSFFGDEPGFLLNPENPAGLRKPRHCTLQLFFPKTNQKKRIEYRVRGTSNMEPVEGFIAMTWRTSRGNVHLVHTHKEFELRNPMNKEGKTHTWGCIVLETQTEEEFLYEALPQTMVHLFTTSSEGYFEMTQVRIALKKILEYGGLISFLNGQEIQKIISIFLDYVADRGEIMRLVDANHPPPPAVLPKKGDPPTGYPLV